MSIRSRKIMFLGIRARTKLMADNLTAICEPIVYTTLNISQPYRLPRHFTGIALFYLFFFFTVSVACLGTLFLTRKLRDTPLFISLSRSLFLLSLSLFLLRFYLTHLFLIRFYSVTPVEVFCLLMIFCIHLFLHP
jgi:hypothetical protein